MNCNVDNMETDNICDPYNFNRFLNDTRNLTSNHIRSRLLNKNDIIWVMMRFREFILNMNIAKQLCVCMGFNHEGHADKKKGSLFSHIYCSQHFLKSPHNFIFNIWLLFVGIFFVFETARYLLRTLAYSPICVHTHSVMMVYYINIKYLKQFL